MRPEIWGPSPLHIKGPWPRPRNPITEDDENSLKAHGYSRGRSHTQYLMKRLKKKINSVQEQYMGESCQRRNVELSTWQAHTPDHATQLFSTTPNHSDVWIDRMSNYPKERKGWHVDEEREVNTSIKERERGKGKGSQEKGGRMERM